MSAYECVHHGAAAGFLARAEPWLLQREAENNLVLSIAGQLRTAPIPNTYLVTVEHDNEVVGCAFRTPPYKLGVTRMPLGGAQALAQDVVHTLKETPSVLGPESVGSVVAAEMAQLAGLRAQAGMRQRIYELTRVVPPAQPPTGKMRLAQHSDFDLLTSWLEAFARETDHGPADMRGYTNAHINNKTVFMWDDDGPKTTAVWAGATPNGVRIGFVYTPPELRGRGYASACVAAASQRALDSGYRFCCLYTDLGNVTSNDIYQKIGYVPIGDAIDYHVV